MKGKFTVALAFFTVLVFGCSTAKPRQPAQDWRKIDNQHFSFILPRDFREVEVHGIDSFIGEFRSQSSRLTFDYGWYSNRLDERWPGFQTSNENIDGKSATVTSFKVSAPGKNPLYVIGAHFPKVDNYRDRLTITLTCNSTNDFETGKMIFRSIKFK